MRIVCVAVAMACLAHSAGAQDGFGELRFRASALANPEAGAIKEDWHPRPGGQLEVATPLTRGELGLAIGHLKYKSITGKPPYSATLFSLSWLSPEAHLSRARLAAGVRLTDYRMDIDDPALVGGLATEEEVMPAVLIRGRIPLSHGLSLTADASYGVLMLGHHTRMTLLSAGGEYAIATPAWLRDFLR